MKERTAKSGGNVFVDLGFSKEEAAVLAMRAELMAHLRSVIDERGWTQQEAAKRLGIGQSRVSDLVARQVGKVQPGHAGYARGAGGAEAWIGAEGCVGSASEN